MATKIPMLLGGTGTEENTPKLNNLKSVIEDAAKNIVGVLRSIEKNTKASLNATRDLVKISKKPKQMTPTVEGPTATPQAVKEKPAGKPQEEGNASVTASAIAAGGIVGGMGLADEALAKTDQTPVNAAQDETNWRRMNLGQKIESGTARGIETVGGALSNLPLVGDQLSRITQAAKVSRIGAETKALEGVPLPDEQMGPPISVYEAQQAQAARDTVTGTYRRRPSQPEPEQMGPPISVFQAEQAQANQAADYAAAGKTMEAAGMSTVTGRKVANLEKGQMQPADYEQAQQAQAAREALARGSRQSPISRADRVQEQSRKLIDTAREMGIQGKVSGKYEGGQLTKIITEDGREIDVSGKLSPAEVSKVDAARKLKPAMDSEQVTQATNENRDLQRQDNQQSPQPIIMNNTSAVGTNTFIPTPASPRGSSPYDAYNNSRAAYR